MQPVGSPADWNRSLEVTRTPNKDVPRKPERPPLPTGGLVLHRWKVIYVSTPKAACTTMMWTIAEIQQERLAGLASSLSSQVTRAMAIHDSAQWRHTPFLRHLPAKQLQAIEDSGEWFVFCLSRHPVDRLWSAWQSKLLMREPYYLSRYGGASWFPRIPTEPENIAEDFRLFVQALEDDPALLGTDPHWQQQRERLRVDTFPYTHVGRVEAMKETLRALEDHLRRQGWQGALPQAKRNVSLLPWDARCLSEETGRRIEQLYGGDMTAFGYTPARTPSQAGSPQATGSSGVVSPVALQAVQEIIARNERIGDLQRLALSLGTRERVRYVVRNAFRVAVSVLMRCGLGGGHRFGR